MIQTQWRGPVIFGGDWNAEFEESMCEVVAQEWRAKKVPRPGVATARWKGKNVIESCPVMPLWGDVL